MSQSSDDTIRDGAGARPEVSLAHAASAGRRGFLRRTVGYLFGTPMAVGFTSLVVTQVMWLLGCIRFMFPNVLVEPPTKFKVGYPESYAPGQVEAKYKAQHGIWIVRHDYEGQTQIYALRRSAHTWGARRIGWRPSRSLNVPAMGAGFTKMDSISKGRHPAARKVCHSSNGRWAIGS